MGTEFKQLGMQAAGGVISGALGMALGNYNDRRQRMQQDKLWQMEMKNRKEMTDYEMEKEYEMWLKTNYGAQKDQMKAANLNPALMYGMGGGAGGQLGTANGNVSGATAPQGGREVMESIGMGMNLNMQRAQMELMAAQADNLKADAENKRGIDRSVAGASIEKMAQETDNLRWQHELLKIQKAIGEMDKHIKEGTMEAEIQSATAEMRSKMAQAGVDEATAEGKIAQVYTDVIGAVLKNQLTQAQTKGVMKGMELTDAQIQKMAADIAQGWKQLELGQQGADANTQNAATQAWKAIMDAGNPGLFNVLGGELQRSIEAVWNAFGKSRPQYKGPKK